jgi:hypothetical protein
MNSRHAKLRRRLFTSVSVLSLILCLATVGLWVRSYWISDSWYRWSDRTGRDVWTLSGAFMMLWGDLGPEHNMPDSGWVHEMTIAYPIGLQWPSVIRGAFPENMIVSGSYVTVPLWLPALLFAITPTYWLLGPRRRLKRRRKLGLCERCGYDLRASPGRCPECGAEKDVTPSAAS